MTTMQIRRGQVFFVKLDPVMGREIGGNKSRPVVVLSINDINDKPLVVSVVPGTKAAEKPIYPNVALVPATQQNGLSCDTIFQGHQLRALDKTRFQSPAIGALSAEHLALVESAVGFSLGLRFGSR